jgi:FlaA1/EpsC-like NDP-sugar epimerase
MFGSNNYISKLYSKISRREKHLIFRLIDCVSIGLSIYFAFSLRFDLFSVEKYLNQYLDLIYIIIPVKLAFFWLAGLYKPVVKYLGVEFFLTAMVASIGSTGILVFLSFVFRLHPFPRSIYILDSLLTLFFLLMSRLIVRWVVTRAVGKSLEDGSAEKVLIYGAGEIGCQLVNTLDRQQKYRVVGLIDDDRQMQRQVIGGIKVHSPKFIKRLAQKYEIESILLAIPSVSKEKRISIVNSIQSIDPQLQIKTIPAMGDIISGKVEISTVRKIDITDLLGRDEIQPIPELLQKNSVNRSVLVTGAGGSIGSELCRQILEKKPKRLVLLERNEFALYNVEIELSEKYPEVEIVPCLSSVTNQSRLEEIFSHYQVEIIYHAAAYKHVPLVEANIQEGIINNVFGTLSCVQAAISCKVEAFVLISTDKAVRPTNVMGTTKRITEMILQAFAHESSVSTRLVMVRFGNVLDSAGSVVPRFRKQIANGENITVTHRDITRYFMSIPEAARLVIQAGAIGTGGEVFLLDMGTPVKIFDLALQMIKLSGLNYSEDIDITLTGLRPGEKLYEELLLDTKKSTKTEHSKIFKAKEEFWFWETLEPILEELKGLAENGNQRGCIQILKDLVPEFKQAPLSQRN